MSVELRKILDIGPGGVIMPGSAQDLRYAGNAGYYAETGTPWIRMWADWPSLQPDGAYAPDDPRSPGRLNLQALDEQIRLARANGMRVLLMPYRFPTWANGTAELAAQRNSDAEISFQHDGPRERGRSGSATCAAAATRPPSRRAGARSSTGCPDDPYGPRQPLGALLRRSCTGATTPASVRGARGSTASSSSTSPTCSCGRSALRSSDRRPRSLLATAQAHLGGSYEHSTMLYAPSISDSDTASSRLYTRYDEFVPALAGRARGDRLRAAPRAGVVAPQLHGRREAPDRDPHADHPRPARRRRLGRARHRADADRVHHRGRRAAVGDAGAVPGRGPARGAGQVPAGRVGAAPVRHGRRGRRGDVRAVPALRRPQLRHAGCSTRTRPRRNARPTRPGGRSPCTSER